MLQIRFREEDGPLKIAFGPHNALLEGDGRITLHHGPILSRAEQVHTRSVASRWIRLGEIAAKAASLIAAIGTITFLLWAWVSGESVPPFVSISAKACAFAFLGSIVSLGGINLFSFKAELKSFQERFEANSGVTACPLLPLFEPESHPDHRPGNPHVCMKCPLGIDITGGRPDGLIHQCRAYPYLNERWRAWKTHQVHA